MFLSTLMSFEPYRPLEAMTVAPPSK